VDLYKNFSACRYIAPTASVKPREGSPKMDRNEHDLELGANLNFSTKIAKI